MTLCAFRVESARKGAISKAQRSFCERRRQVLDETSTRTQLERWPGFGHRWSRLQKHVTLIRNAPRGAFQSSHESVCECAEPGRPAVAPKLLHESINQQPSPHHSTVAATAALLTAGCAATARGFPRPATHLARRITAAPRRQGAIVGTRDSEAPRATPSHNCIRDHADAKHNKIPAWFQGRGGSAACRATTEAAAHHRIAPA